MGKREGDRKREGGERRKERNTKRQAKSHTSTGETNPSQACNTYV